MRRWIAVFAVFALAAIVAGYVALFPFASESSAALRPALERLDQTAAHAVALGGRSMAVIVPLATGAVLALLVAVIGRGGGQSEPAPAGGIPAPRGTSHPGASRQGRRRKLVHPDPELVWRPEPDPVEPDMDHVPGLPRDAELRGNAEWQPDAVNEAAPVSVDVSSDDDVAPEDMSPLRYPPLPSVVLVRHPRERGTDEQTWFDSASWLGGLPRLGERAWPHDEYGALPFAAQIDLAELAAAFPESPLPLSGTLAFFLGSGAVIEVPEANNPFTAPPADLPPAFDEGGEPLPAHASRLSRPYFPFWPVSPVASDASETAGGDENAWLDARVARRREGYAAKEPVTRLWWHGAMHLADCLHIALDGADHQVANEQDRLRHARARLETLAENPHTTSADLDEAHAALAASEAEIPALEGEQAELGRMIEAMEGFVSGRDPWAALSEDEVEVVGEVLAQVHHDCARLVRFCVPQSLEPLATVSLRAMVTGDLGAFGQVPPAELDRINSANLLAIGHQHQLFGAGASHADQPDDILLLQLGCDDLVEWNWGEGGVFQFRIAPEDLAAARWDRVTLAFEAS
ncbi:DUF1963 domain-containing protein [Novosphingobium sp. BL-8H]|uniref:DUF1963 domain-containing protein n=1 Tax=Novosphingobium sp. BL-8H TaxID=3127640 RepID=UPI00375680B8